MATSNRHIKPATSSITTSSSSESITFYIGFIDTGANQIATSDRFESREAMHFSEKTAAVIYEKTAAVIYISGFDDSCHSAQSLSIL